MSAITTSAPAAATPAGKVPRETGSLPDFDLKDCSVTELVSVVEWAHDLAGQRTDTASLGKPFVRPYLGKEDSGLVDDTVIGKVVNVIHEWAYRQHRRALDRLAVTMPMNVLDAEEKAMTLMRDRIGETWDDIRQLVDVLEAEDLTVRALRRK